MNSVKANLPLVTVAWTSFQNGTPSCQHAVFFGQ